MTRCGLTGSVVLIDSTDADIPSFEFRLKSIRRYIFLCAAAEPDGDDALIVPPPFFLPRTSDFSGLFSRGFVHSRNR